MPRGSGGRLMAMGAAVAWLTASGCQPSTLSADWQRIEPRVDAPAFRAETLDGASVQLADYRGQVVLLDFWASWCPPCRQSMPSLEHIYRKFRKEGVTVLFVNSGETREQIRAFVERRYTAPIVLDPEHFIEQLYAIKSLPRLYIIDRQGQLAYTHTGYGSGLENDLRIIIEELLAAPEIKSRAGIIRRGPAAI